MSYRFINFFSKNGTNITPTVNADGIFEFSISLEKTSAGLFSTEHLFLLEEVLYETEGEFTQKPKQVFVPVLIQILKYLRDWGDPVKKEDLRKFFVFNANDDEFFVTNFLNNNSKYLNNSNFGSVQYYSLSSEGKIYLESYEASEDILNASNYRLSPTFTRPRTEANTELGEDVYLTFDWTSYDNDENLFMFFIDKNDDTIYKDNELFSSDKQLPAIIPAYKNDLNASLTNPYWKIWSEPYRFDFARHSDGRTNSTDMFFNGDSTKHRILSSQNPPNQNPFQINIALNSKTEGFFERTLEINITHQFRKEDGTLGFDVTRLAKINFFGEVVAEDERYKNILEDFGREINESEVYIFRNNDIYESLPNYIDLNNKRKELLLAGEEIYPYIGSYKAFINALKFFGYQDLRLKEYFVNVLMSQPKLGRIYYSAIEIPFDLKLPESGNLDWNDTVFGNQHNSKYLKKSSRFGLYYDINKTTGEFDDLGFPITTDAFQFTNEEVLIKLYGLKKVLEEKFLPHNVRIIDITGEGVYFAKFKMNVWQDLNRIINIAKNNPPDFEVFPKTGNLKDLNKLLNIFKKNVDASLLENITINKDTVLSSIVENSLKDFIQTYDTNFDFTPGLEVEKIKEFFPDYFTLKSAIFEHIRNSKCDVSNRKDLYRELSYSVKLFGLPVLLKLKPYNVLWSDLDSVTWDELDIDQDLKNRSYFESNFESIYTWDNIAYCGAQEVDWFVTHQDKQYCYNTIDTFSTNKEILVFLPYEGFYDVSCVVRDLTNFPNMAGKKKCIEVTGESIDFTAFGRSSTDTGTWDDYKDKTFDELTFSWDSKTYSNYNTTLDDCQLTWDDLHYEKYSNQTLVNNVKKSKILDYNERTSEIILEGRDFYNNFVSTYDTNIKHSIVFERDSAKVPIATDIDVENATNKVITLKGKHDLKLGQRINCYNSFSTRSYIINGNKIIVNTNNYKVFKVGEHIMFYDFNKDRNYYFEIIESSVNISKNIVEVIVKDNGSLNQIMRDKLESKYNNFVFKVSSSTYDSNLDITYVTVEDNYNSIKKIKRILQKNKSVPSFSKSICYRASINSGKTVALGRQSFDEPINFKAEYGIHSGYFVFDLNEVKLNSEENTLIRVNSNRNICLLTTDFEAQYGEFDIDHARKYSNVKYNHWDFNDKLTWDDYKNTTWDNLDYVGNTISGFKIRKASTSGWLSIDNQKIEWDFRFVDNDGITVDLPNDEVLLKLVDLLKASKIELIRDYNYNLIEGEFILASIKNPGVEKIHHIQTNFLTDADKNTFPRNNFAKWEKEDYFGENRPASWNVYKRKWLENNEIYENPNHDLAKIKEYDSLLNGAFCWDDIFVSNKNMKIHRNMKLFIVPTKVGKNNSDKQLEWELWEESKNKLLIKTKSDFLIWNFVDSGIYTVKLNLIDKQNNKTQYNKKSWIVVE